MIFHPFAGGGPCWADCSNFFAFGWHPRHNHAYQILSRSRRGLRSYGDLNHAPFLDLSLWFFRYCPCASVYQISSLYLFSLWRYLRVYAKNYGGHVTQTTPLFCIFLCEFLRHCYSASVYQI